MMMHSIRTAITNPQSSCFQLRSAFFHSTAFLERGRRNNYWNSRSNSNKNFGRYRRNHFKENLMRNSSAFVDYLFQSWDSGFDHDEQPSKTGPSWFRKQYDGSRRNKAKHGNQTRGQLGFDFCEDDDDVEAIFRIAFGDRFFFCSFANEDHPNSRNSWGHSRGYKSSWRHRDQSEDEYEDIPNHTKRSSLASERVALGLSASGPLKLEDVKNAYRASALKWHPDRHQGSSKADAEEKFKLCTAAYQSLCESLAVNLHHSRSPRK